jgi:heme exporter protein C
MTAAQKKRGHQTGAHFAPLDSTMNPLLLWFHTFGAPPTAYRVAGKLAPWFFWSAGLLAAVALYGGLVLAPRDYQQGDAYRIIFIHVPCAWMGLFAYFFMAANAFIALVWRIKLSEVLAMASAPVGAAFTFITLVTGSLWGKPMWGTWWSWDARLTSELFLLFLYFGVIGLHAAIEDRRQAARAAGFLALIGVVNLPVIHFSVNWWNTLHQGQTVRLMGPSKIDAGMLWPLLTMALATHLWFFGSLLVRTRTGLLELDGGKEWVRAIALGSAASADGARA